MSRARLIERLETAWQAFLDSHAGLTDREMIEPGVNGTWSVKDVVAHVTVWEAEALAHLPTILDGGKPPRYSFTHGGIDAFNAATLAKRRDLSLFEVLRRRDETHGRLIAFLRRVPEEHFHGETRFRRRLRLDTYGHYSRHTAAIMRWRSQKSQPS
jgi:hypothetical protein